MLSCSKCAITWIAVLVWIFYGVCFPNPSPDLNMQNIEAVFLEDINNNFVKSFIDFTSRSSVAMSIQIKEGCDPIKVLMWPHQFFIVTPPSFQCDSTKYLMWPRQAFNVLLAHNLFLHCCFLQLLLYIYSYFFNKESFSLLRHDQTRQHSLKDQCFYSEGAKNKTVR